MRDFTILVIIIVAVMFCGVSIGKEDINKELLERKIKMHHPETGELIFTKDYRK